MAGLAKIGGKVRSSEGGKKKQPKSKRKESFYDRAYRLRRELPWPYNTLVDLKNKKKDKIL
tara:strand:+ start:193 stop:375 length:183 start_codon:yes stop_codon:yes gene_type:complete